MWSHWLTCRGLKAWTWLIKKRKEKKVLSPSVSGHTIKTTCFTRGLLRDLTCSMLHTLTVSCYGESNRSALLRCWTVNGDRAGKMTGQRMRCFCNTVQHILWVTEMAGIPSGSLPSGQETVSPPSRLQKAISPRVTISHEPPVQSKTHEHCKRKGLDIHSRKELV